MNNSKSKERTMLTALLLSSFGPFVTGISVYLSNSGTLTADFIRRLTELFAMFVSWYLFRYINRKKPGKQKIHKYEQLSKSGVGIAMIVSSIIMLIMALNSLRSVTYPSGNMYPGLAIALLGALTNGFFWRRYEKLNAHKHDEITRNQAVLYKAKTAVDIYVLLAALSIILLKPGRTTSIIDLLGNIGVSAYLAYTAVSLYLPKNR